MFTCRDGKGGELSSQASKMLYKQFPLESEVLRVKVMWNMFYDI